MPGDLMAGLLSQVHRFQRLAGQHDVDIKRLWRRLPTQVDLVSGVLGGVEDPESVTSIPLAFKMETNLYPGFTPSSANARLVTNLDAGTTGALEFTLYSKLLQGWLYPATFVLATKSSDGRWYALGGEQSVRGQTNATWTRNASCSISVYQGGSDTGIDVTANDDGFIPTAQSPLGTSKLVRIRWMNAGWMYNGHDCG